MMGDRRFLGKKYFNDVRTLESDAEFREIGGWTCAFITRDFDSNG